MFSLQQYQNNNNSYKRTLVFHFGAFAGFYSEYINMLKAIAYCLVHKIRFVIYSKDSVLCPNNGWTDFFEPFCDEVTDEFHHTLNKRTPRKDTQTAFFSVFLKRKIKVLLGKQGVAPVSWSFYDTILRNRLYKIRYRFSYFTYDLWNDFVHITPSSKITVGDLFQGSYYELMYNLDKIIWHYNLATENAIREMVQSLSLPKVYLAMHIRKGDKEREATVFGWESYVYEASKQDCNNWFIFTDDYSVVENIRNYEKGICIYTLCSPLERGYVHESLISADATEKNNRILRMFAAVDICKVSVCFIGTKTSNPYHVIELAHHGENCISLDSTWL